MKTLLTLTALCSFMLSLRGTAVAQATNGPVQPIQYFNVSFDLTSHEEVGVPGNTQIVTRRITNNDLIFGLLQPAGFQNSDLSSATLLWRSTGDSTNTGMILRVGTNEVSVAQYLQISYPQTPGYCAVASQKPTPNGPVFTGDERIMRITFGPGVSNFDMQGFSRARYVNSGARPYVLQRVKLAGGGHVVSPDGTGRDGVLEGTFKFLGPIRQH